MNGRTIGTTRTTRTRSDWCRLLAATLVIGGVWCVGLPWIASLQSVENRLRFLDERGIDPSAMFYTELDSMKPILERLEK